MIIDDNSIDVYKTTYCNDTYYVVKYDEQTCNINIQNIVKKCH